MSAGNILFLCITVGALTLFGGVLAWASWMEAQEEKHKALTANAQANRNQKTNSVGRTPGTRVGMGVPDGGVRREKKVVSACQDANVSTAKSRPF